MEQKDLKFNKPQKRFVLNQPAEAYSIWSRGTGKSFIIAWLIHLIVKTMPRSAWGIVGQTYKQILTRTLPSTLHSLEQLGYKRGRDYLVKQKPTHKMGFDTPFEAPLEYDHFIIFKNGTGFHLISLDGGGGSSRGLNTDGIIADESLLIDKPKFDKEVSSTNRGNNAYFGHLPYHHGIFHFSSMPYGKEASWLLDAGKYYYEGKEKDQLDYMGLRNKLIELELKFIDNKDPEYRVKVWKQIKALKKQMRFRKSEDGILYSEADVFDNLLNLGIEYIEQQRRELTDLIFLIEILNKHPDKIEGGFYPTLDRNKHGYRNSFDNAYLNSLENTGQPITEDSRVDDDVVKTLPLRIAVDWGASINSMTICQHITTLNELRFLKSMYVKHPKILDDLAEDFCTYYRNHPTRKIYFIYDHTGNSKVPNSDITYAEQFAKILRKNGWSVSMVTKGAPPTHKEKYLLWGQLLKEHLSNYPRIRFNLNNCNEAVTSMEQAPAKDGPKGIEKNKQSERNPSLPQEQATHLSDTCDLQVTSLFMHLIQYQSAFVDVHFNN